MTSISYAHPSLDLADLRARIAGDVSTPADADWNVARQAWNLAVDQRPAAVVHAASAEDVVETVRYASAAGLRVAPQGTGHNAAPLGDLSDTILLKTSRMRGVSVDAERRVARAEAGVLWIEVVEAAAEHGLATLAGSSPDVGVVGYTVGGGLSFLGRKYGLSANSVEAVELVTADGRLVRATREEEPDLFWAVRGGGGSFGVVTALEVRLYPHAEVTAGVLWWPIERAAEVLQTWRRVVEAGLPDETTTIGRLLRFPPLEELPEPIRGKSFAVVEVIHLGEPGELDESLAPLRALEPVQDTVARIPIAELIHLHMDPEHPVPGKGDGLMLADLTAEAVDAFLAAVGPGTQSQLLTVEIRQLGGELARPRPENGALASLDARYIVFGAGIAATPEMAGAAEHYLHELRRALAPWTAEHMYLNFAESSRPSSSFWGETAYHRLRRIKAAVDPNAVIRANHPVG